MLRSCVVALAIALAACSSSPDAAQKPAKDLTAEVWYPETARQLAEIAAKARDLAKAGQWDDLSVLVSQGQLLQARLLEAARPTLPAMEAITDLDDAYARLLVHNERIGWARDFFQKNAVRWKNWRPQTPETERRYKAALEGVAECDRKL